MALVPGEFIGILGGGQLGRMLAMSAARLGLKTIVLDPDPNSPAAQVANHHLCAAYDDENSLATLAERCGAVTYEFENIPAETARFFDSRGRLHPGAKALEKSQDRLIEKNFLCDLSIGTAPYFPVASAADLYEATKQVSGPSILKTRRFGYDGKGQMRLSGNEDEAALEQIWKGFSGQPSILEGMVFFKREISVIAARDMAGDIVSYEPAENIHRDGILHTSTLPASITRTAADRARIIAGKIAEALKYVGVIGIEFFVLQDDELLVNEMAPRVHNSGHWTEAACTVSQFEQHIRAVAGWPLGDTHRHSDCRMTNLIGDEFDQWRDLISKDKCFLHLYGKAETRPGRKMGHVTELF